MSDLVKLQVPVLDAEYATIIIEMLLYGGYTTLFYKCIRILNSRQLQTDAHVNNKIFTCLCSTLIVLYLITSMNLATTIFCNYQKIILVPFQYNQLQDSEPGASIKKYTCSMPYNWVTSVKGIIFVIAILISDLFLVFRSYVVWNRRLGMVILPAIAFLADTAIGILYIFDSKEADSIYQYIDTGLVYVNQSSLAIMNRTYDLSRVGLFSVTLTLNICCTSLIGFQIWRIQKQAFKNSPQVGYLKYTLVTIIESGVIYSSWIAILLATYVQAGSWDLPSSLYNFSYGVYGSYLFFQDTTVQIIAITFSIIILRIGQGVSTGDGKSRNRSPSQSLSHARFCSGTQSSIPGRVSTGERGFQVQVSFDRRIWHDDNIEMEGGTHTGQEASAILVQNIEDGVKLRPEESV